MSGKETYLSASSRKNRRLHYQSPPTLLLDVPHPGSQPPMPIVDNDDAAKATGDSVAAEMRSESASDDVSAGTMAGTGDGVSADCGGPLGLSPGTPHVQEVLACSDEERKVTSEKAGVDSGGAIIDVADVRLSPVVPKGGRSTKGDSGSETPEWELLNLSPESRPHSPRSGGVRSLKSSASNSSLWSWADVEDGRILESGGLDAALIDTSHFYFLQADLASAVGTANMPDASSAFHSPARSWSLSPPPSLPPSSPSHTLPDSLTAATAVPIPTPSLASPTIPSATPPPPVSPPRSSKEEDAMLASLAPLKGPEPAIVVSEPISESMKLLDEETVLQALVGVGLGAPCPRVSEGLADKGLRSLVNLSGQTASFEVGSTVVGGPSCPLFPEYRHHSVGAMEEHHHHHHQHVWTIPVAATAGGATSSMASMGFGSPITEASFPLAVEGGGGRLGRSGRPENLGSGGDGLAVERNAGGTSAPKRGSSQDSWSDAAVGEWEGEEASKGNGGGSGVRKEGLAGVVEDCSGGVLERRRSGGGRSSAGSGGSRSSATVASGSPADVQRREFWAIVYRTWEKRNDLLLKLKAALEIQKSVLWSLALAGAVLGVMMVGGWHRDRSQNRDLRLQIKAKDERIGQLMVQVSQLKEALANRRRVLVLRSVSSRQFSH